MIAKAEAPKLRVVVQNIFAQLLDARLVLKVKVRLQKPATEFDDLVDGEVLAWLQI